MTGAEWYYSDRGERRGPVDEPMLRRLAELGEVNGTTLIWREGMADWEPVHRQFPDLVPPPPPRSAPMRPGPGPNVGRDYHEQVGLREAVRRAFSNFATFRGRANRGEFWWFVLANFLIAILLSMLDSLLFGSSMGENGLLSGIWSLVVLIPGLALSVRRLHDTDRSGWWQLIGITIIGLIPLIYWLASPGTVGANRFGEDPTGRGTV